MRNARNIEAKAAEWLVRRDSNSLAIDNDFAAWLAADPRHRAAYLRLAAAWERSSPMKRLRPESPVIDADLLARKRSGGLRFWIPMSIAAGLAALSLAGTWWFASERGVQSFRTDLGGLSRVVLADGSTMTLNTETEIRVRLLPRRREITLVAGEARFTVAHDPKRPFEVSVGGRIVRAVGTAFDVRLKPDEAVEVMVTEGRVALETASASEAVPDASISAGESAVAKDGKVTVRPVSTSEASRRLAWETGELSFQGETLREAVAEFNRYNHRKLHVEDPSIADLQVGGNFHALDIDSFVAALERSFGVTHRTTEDGTVLLRPSTTFHR